MTNWPYRGVRSGDQSSRYPAHPETAPGVTPGRPALTRLPEDEVRAAAAVCPVGALSSTDAGLAVDYARCVHCQRCGRSDPAAEWEETYEWAAVAAREPLLGRRFRRSLHVRFVDAGACGACLGELRLLDSPRYNFHRLGIFFTPSPRNADVLLVAGPATENMRAALAATLDAMPEPRRVVAMGVCAVGGGIFGRNFASAGGAGAVVPVDVLIPGCPPPPLAVVHGLLVATGRAAPASLEAR